MAMQNTNKIIQWNCRGLKANFNEILLLLQEDPVAVCLQESFLKSEDNITFRGYELINSFGPTEPRVSGGVSIIVNEHVPHSVVPLNTNLQAVAVRVTLHKTITICSLYLPPSQNVDPEDIYDLFQQLPTPFLLTGDLNAHNTLWGSRTTDKRGKDLETVFTDNNLCLLNDKSSTYLHPATGTYSSIDLSICSPLLLLDFDWKVGNDLCGSDHFPIFLTNLKDLPEEDSQRWKLNKADWDQYKLLCESNFSEETFEDLVDPIAHFTNILQNVADRAIPKTSTVPKQRNKPWFNDEVKEAINDRKRVIRQFNTRPTMDNLNTVKVFRARARRAIRENKKGTWRNFVSKLNNRTSVKTVWDMVRKIKGKTKGSKVNHLKKNNNLITSKKDIANTLGESFSKNSSSENYTDEFQRVKNNKEKVKLNFSSGNAEDYNKPFSIRELKHSLERAHDTSAGPDNIHYQLLKHLPDSVLSILLSIFNNIWESGNFPTSWHEAIVVPIPKPGKDHTDPTNYRPIALTSCICKTMERMINDRLVWYLESNGIISDFQCGFRRQRSTVDHLVRLETFIREAFASKQHLVSVFFDLEKAYDTTWKYGIMKDLYDMGLRGNLPNFIDNFLKERQFRVKVGSTLSDHFEQEMGVPQGSILSVTLFSVKINSITKTLNPGVDCSLYVDDFLICYRSSKITTIERQLQLCLNKIHDWSVQNGFKFSRSKTVCMHFCRKTKMHNDPSLFLNGHPIPVVEEFKFLGLIFDKKLTFLPHIKYLKDRCQKALDLLRVLSNTDWGADRKVLLRLYRALIRSKLDYGCIVYGSTYNSYLKMLDPIHNQGLRLCLGAFRTSPAESLYVEANEPSLSDRRLKLSLQYATKLSSNPTNPAFDCVFKPNHATLFERRQKIIPTFGLRIKPHLEECNIDIESVATFSVPEIPPWLFAEPKIVFDMDKQKKSITNPALFHEKFDFIRLQYGDYKFYYTDGSKANDKVAAASVTSDNTVSVRLPDRSSIFSAETKAIQLALSSIEESNFQKSIICSDSHSCLQALGNLKFESPDICSALVQLHNISETGKEVILCWIPSHVGIRGNDKADTAAKAALHLPITDYKVPFSDYKMYINRYIFNRWQDAWNNAVLNKLHDVKPILGEWPPAYRNVRRDEVVLGRCRIGHTFYTNSYLLKAEPRPDCIGCQCPLTVRHILIDCTDFSHIRQKYFNKASMRDLFNDIKPEIILDFLKEIQLYRKF